MTSETIQPENSKSGESSGSHLVLVTGMSGAGKSSALRILEDLGYEVIDNIPLRLVPSLIAPGFGVRDGATNALAIGVDARTRDFGIALLLDEIDAFRSRHDLDVSLLFIDCDDEVLRRRFTETRRRHPLATDRSVTDGIAAERVVMANLRERADHVIDTSVSEVADLRRQIESGFSLDRQSGLSVFVTSFAFRDGLPREADLVFDVRFLANPHYVDALRPRTGLDPEVAAFVKNDPDFASFFDSLCSMLMPLLPRYADEGKRYLTVAIGCTGGRHRSVATAQMLEGRLREAGYPVSVKHRNLV